MSITYLPNASAAIQAVYDDPNQEQLADRIAELLDILETNPGDARVRRIRMQTPKLWCIPIYGSRREFAILWELTASGAPFVQWAGDRF